MPTTTIETNGNVTLTHDGSHYFVNDGSGATAVSYQGAPIGPNSYANWKIVQAESDAASGGFKVLLKNSDNGGYAIWNLNANGAYTSGYSVADVRSVEADFAADIDGDGSIGIPQVTWGLGEDEMIAAADETDILAVQQRVYFLDDPYGL